MENPSMASPESEKYRFSLSQGWTFGNDAPVPVEGIR
jgi:hypothetical protein